jgi:hypothetical protein
MIQGFTFERALSWPFSAPHVATFPWMFGLAYALIFSVVMGAIAVLSAGDISAWFNALAAADGANDPEAGLNALFGGFVPLLPWLGLTILASWVIWAMFETASQRRFVFGQGFSLGFGGDELRMMVVGLLWSILGLVIMAVPTIMMLGGLIAALDAGSQGLSDEEVGAMIIAPMLGAMGLMVLLFPLYIFLATRLAPCFGLTLKEKKIRFFDAWNVSRGRFWPILGAYVILAICGSILVQVITGIAQLLVMQAMMDFADTAENGGDMAALMLSPGFLVPVGIYLFIALFVQGLLQHVVGGPAAFAARHDPRGGVEQETQLEAFN